MPYFGFSHLFICHSWVTIFVCIYALSYFSNYFGKILTISFIWFLDLFYLIRHVYRCIFSEHFWCDFQLQNISIKAWFARSCVVKSISGFNENFVLKSLEKKRKKYILKCWSWFLQLKSIDLSFQIWEKMIKGHFEEDLVEIFHFGKFQNFFGPDEFDRLV